MNKNLRQPVWQFVQLLGALLLFNLIAMASLGYISKVSRAFTGLALLVLLCLNLIFVIASRGGRKENRQVPFFFKSQE
jgi:hypothetical protein